MAQPEKIYAEKGPPKPMICLIAAVGPNREIGFENRMPWHLPRDLRFFRRATLGHMVIMGRKTYESLGRALPKRRNVVVSRNAGLRIQDAEVVHSVEEALALAAKENTAFVIGGGDLFRQTLPHAHVVLLTEISNRDSNLPLFPDLFSGEIFFPELSPINWDLTRQGRWFVAYSNKPWKRTFPPPDKRRGICFRFVQYTRRSVPLVSGKTSPVRPASVRD
jgi:dihydrofolate reductase